MEPALKQRLLGAAVLVALAVTFLPLVVMQPAPESGASSVPLEVPAAPDAGTRSIEMAIGPEAAGLPVVQTPAAETPPADGTPPPTTAGGDYAVTFGRYATAADAERVVAALRASQLAGYHEPSVAGGRTLHRVLIGPFASRALAEGARLRAAHVNDQVAAQVIALDVGAAPPQATPATTPAPSENKPAEKTAETPARPAEPVKPATPPTTPPPAPTAPPAAASVGFAVQLGAFANAEEAKRLSDRARSAGFPAFVERVGTAAGSLNRVRIGPVTDRSEAERLQARAAAALGVSGIVRPHP